METVSCNRDFRGDSQYSSGQGSVASAAVPQWELISKLKQPSNLVKGPIFPLLIMLYPFRLNYHYFLCAPVSWFYHLQNRDSNGAHTGSKKWLQFLTLLESYPSQCKSWTSPVPPRIKSYVCIPSVWFALGNFPWPNTNASEMSMPDQYTSASRGSYMAPLEWPSWPRPCQEDQSELTGWWRPDSKTEVNCFSRDLSREASPQQPRYP